jgi:hypothetical protein
MADTVAFPVLSAAELAECTEFQIGLELIWGLVHLLIIHLLRKQF